MAIRSKNGETDKKVRRQDSGFGMWVIFFLGLNLFVATTVLGIYTAANIGGVQELQTVLTDNDVKQQPAFKEQMIEYFDMATGAAVGDEDKIYNYNDWQHYYYINTASSDPMSVNVVAEKIPPQETQVPIQSTLSQQKEYLQAVKQVLDQEGVNLEYYILASDGTVLTNTSHQLLNESNHVILPKGYDYFLAYDGDSLSGYYEKSGFFNLEDNGYNDLKGMSFTKQYQEGGNYLTRYPQLADCRIVMAVKTDLEENYYAYSSLYWIKDQIMLQRYCLISTMVLWGVAVLMLMVSFIGRKAKRRFDHVLAEYSAKVWVEFKIVAMIILVMTMLMFVFSTDVYYWSDWWNAWVNLLLYLCCGGFCFWVLYALVADLFIHRRAFFHHNMVNSYLELIRSKEALQPFQERILKRFYTLIKTEALLLLAAIVTCWTIVIPIMAIAFGAYILARYIRQYKEFIEDLGKISDQIERIKGGDMDTPLHLSPLADLYPVAQNLNSVQEGVVTATEQKMKSERMKIDLLTNVSHDLKTPLTSIISYTDLLSQEEGLNEAAQDYVRILRQKSDRLKALINDLFDLSKATSSNLDVHLEHIDFGKLLNQVIAELAEEIEQSQLSFKINIPNEPIPIISDGAKMHRVFDNLLINAIKYSLEGSRVFVDLKVVDGLATATIKNTAKYEMDFDAETVIGRFVRGDKARSTEGSGLGLAIAQSYTDACGGMLELTIDGDLFKVSVTFDTQAAKDAAEKMAQEAQARLLAEDGAAAAAEQVAIQQDREPVGAEEAEESIGSSEFDEVSIGFDAEKQDK